MPKTGKNSKGSVFKKKTSGSGSNADFAKKKAKVGKKVERSTVTKISVQSKQIHVPLQTQITAASPQDERAVLDKVLKQLHHFSGSNRTQALTDLNNFVLGSAQAESYSSLIIPQAMELLFDDEVDTREALLVLMSTITVNIRPQSMKAVMSVLITYICSGLTSLNKGVRKDALLLLCQVAETQAELMTPFLDKILKNIFGSLSRASLIFNSSQSGAASSTPSASSTSGNMGIGSKEKRDTSKDKSLKAKAAASDSARSNLLLLLLHVIRMVLSSGMPGDTSHGNAQLIAESIEKVHQHRRYKEGYGARASNAFGAAGPDGRPTPLPQAPLRRVALFHSTNPAAAGPSLYTPVQAREGARVSDAGQISADTESNLCDQLRTVWTRLSLGGSLLGAAEVRSLTETASTMLLVLRARAGAAGGCEAFASLLRTALSHFPYSAAEAQVASSNDELVQQSSRAVHALNVLLCEVALGSVQDMERAPGAAPGDVELVECMSEVSSYLLASLDGLTNRFRDRARRHAISLDEGQSYGADKDQRMDIDNDHDDSAPAESHQSRNRGSDPPEGNPRRGWQKGQVYSVDALSRRRGGGDMGATKGLFDCLQVLILDPRVSSWCAASSQLTQSGDKGNPKPGATDSNSTHSQNVLYRLSQLNAALAEYPCHEGGHQHSQKDIRTVVSASIACLTLMCIRCDQGQATSILPNNAFSAAEELHAASLGLAQTLVPMPALLSLQGWEEEERRRSTDLFLVALLSVLRRLPSVHYLVAGGGEEQQTKRPFFQDASSTAVASDSGAPSTARWSEETRDRLHTLLRLVSSLFLEPREAGGSSVAPGTQGALVTAGSFYSSCDAAQRQLLLDIYAQTPLQEKDFSAVTAALGALMAPSEVSWDERRGFLRALLRRRMDLSPADVVSVLFQMLSAQSSRLKELADDEQAVLSTLLEASSSESSRLACEIATTLVAISTLSAPQKIVVFLKGRLLKLGALADVPGMPGPYADAHTATRHHWTRAHYKHCALADICRKLLPPCLLMLGNDDDEESGMGMPGGRKESGAQAELDAGKDAVACVLACVAHVAISKAPQTMPSFSDGAASAAKTAFGAIQPGVAPGGALSREARVDMLLVEPFARLLSTAVPGARSCSLLSSHLDSHGISQTDVPGTSPSLIADYPFLETYLRGLLAAWSAAASARELLSLVQSLALFLGHYCCAEACLKCKGFLRAYIALLAASEQGVGENLGEEEAAARQALRLVLTDMARDLQ